MENEIWKDIPGYEGLYLISNFGNAKRIERLQFTSKRKPRVIEEGFLKPCFGRAGYLRISLSSERGRVKMYLHRAVGLAFISNPLSKKEINHKDGIKTNNNVSNLEWCSHRENVIHAIKTGLKIYKSPTNEQLKKISGLNNHQTKMVMCTITGELMSGLEASKRSGVPRSTLYGWLNGERPNKSSYIKI